MVQTTLLTELTQEKNELKLSSTTSPNLTKDLNWPIVSPDLGTENLADVLDYFRDLIPGDKMTDEIDVDSSLIEMADQRAALNRAGITIDHKSVKDLTKYFDATIKAVVPKIMRSMRSPGGNGRPGRGLVLSTSTEESRVPREPGSLHINHRVWLNGRHNNRAILVGLHKVTKAWKTDDLFLQLEDKAAGRRQEPEAHTLWPLRQLLNLMQKEGTNFGHIVTEREVVTCRLTGVVKADGGHVMTIQRVHWTERTEECLSAELALTAHCLKAVEDRFPRAQ